MSKRFGRNQKRKMRAQLAMERELHQVSEKANRHTIRELKALLESRAQRMEEMEHAIKVVVRAVNSSFPELLAFNGEPIKHVTFFGDRMRVNVPLVFGPSDRLYREGNDPCSGQAMSKAIHFVEFSQIVEHPDVANHLGTLVHFFSKTEGGDVGNYRMSMDMLRQEMSPAAMQQMCIDMARHAIRQLYTFTAKKAGYGHGY